MVKIKSASLELILFTIKRELSKISPDQIWVNAV